MNTLKHAVLAVVAAALLALAPAYAEPAIYLVRHAEKMADSDPGLTEKGHARAAALAELMQDVDLAAIYSTDTRRTRETAAPTASAKDMKVEFYLPQPRFEYFATGLRMAFEAGERSYLVVGHSNTTPVLASLLTGQEFEMIDEKEYSRLYVVTKGADGNLVVTIETFDP